MFKNFINKWVPWGEEILVIAAFSSVLFLAGLPLGLIALGTVALIAAASSVGVLAERRQKRAVEEASQHVAYATTIAEAATKQLEQKQAAPAFAAAHEKTADSKPANPTSSPDAPPKTPDI